MSGGDYMTFGAKLRQARQKKGYTQKQLAQLIDAKHNSISNWENDQNKPDPDMIEIICGVLEIKPNYLFNQTDDSYTTEEENLIENYRHLDSYGRYMINQILDIELQRIQNLNYSKVTNKTAEGNRTCYTQKICVPQNHISEKNLR